MAVAPGSSKAVAASWVMVADPLSVMTGRKGIPYTNCPGYRICCITTDISSIVCKDVIACLCGIYSTTFTDRASFVGISGRCPRIGVKAPIRTFCMASPCKVMTGGVVFDNHRSGCCHTIVRVVGYRCLGLRH